MVQLQLPTFWDARGGESVTVYWKAPQWQLAAWVEVLDGLKVGRLARKAVWISLGVGEAIAVGGVLPVTC
jgi:hypothetical protein